MFSIKCSRWGLVLLLLWGCQTRPLDDFAKLKAGMQKVDVLDQMGNPSFTQRWRGMDRWTYVINEDRASYAQVRREVHFYQGKVVYLGAEYVPEISAEEQDRQNEESNLAFNLAYEKRKSERKYKSFENYEREIQGQDEIRFVPTYVPVR